MTDLAWQIPVWTLAAVMLLRLILAPYWIYQQQREDIKNLELKIEHLESENTELLDRRTPEEKSKAQRIKMTQEILAKHGYG